MIANANEQERERATAIGQIVAGGFKLDRASNGRLEPMMAAAAAMGWLGEYVESDPAYVQECVTSMAAACVALESIVKDATAARGVQP